MASLKASTGYDLKLEQVYVEVCLYPLLHDQASVDLLHQASANTPLLPGFSQDRCFIWDYLANIALEKLNITVLGAPGFGKTALLQHIMVTLAQSRKSPQQRSVPYTFPVLLFLEKLEPVLRNKPNISLVDAILTQLPETFNHPKFKTWMDRCLKERNCLILLDGLDNIPDSSRRETVVEWIQTQFGGYRDNRFVITSRRYGYSNNPLRGVVVLEMQAFTLVQVEQFVRKWCHAQEMIYSGKDDPDIQLRAHENANELLGTLYQQPALLTMAINPLLLTLIAIAHYSKAGSLPSERIRLYAKMCQVLLDRRQEASEAAKKLSAEQKQQILCLLAYALMERELLAIDSTTAGGIITADLRKMARIEAKDFLPLTENTSGLLLDRGDGHYRFVHRTFQEYLAAVYVKEKNLEHELKTQVTKEWWHETIRFYCAQVDATAIIRACLESQPLTASTLTLACQCEEENLGVQQGVRDQLNTVLNGGIEDPDPERRHVIALVVLERRLRQMVRLREEIYMDRSLVTCAEYQVFLDEQQAQGKDYRPDHWADVSFPKGSGNAPVLGIRRSDALAFCEWLSTRNTLWQYRLPHAGELSVKEGEQWNELHAGTGYWTDNEDEKQQFEWVQETLPADFQQSMILGFDAAARRHHYDFSNIYDSNMHDELVGARTRIDRDARQSAFYRAGDSRYIRMVTVDQAGNSRYLDPPPFRKRHAPQAHDVSFKYRFLARWS